jgi:hypothetical protein
MRASRIALAACLICINAEAFDFKGIELGKPSSPEQVQERLGVKCGPGFDGQVCNGSVTIAREPAKLNLRLSAQGTVERIYLVLSPDAFSVVAPELIAKFGEPTKTSKYPVQNRLGATYEQEMHHWMRDDGAQVTYMRYANSLDRSSIYFSTKADRELLTKDKKNRGGDI